MKNTLLILILLFICTASYAQQPQKYRYTAWQCHNLKGEVQTMMTSTGDTLRFDRLGELVNEEGNRLLEIPDETHRHLVVLFPNEYTRHESNMIDSEAAKKENWYVFDHQERVVKSIISSYILMLEKIYVYPPHNYDSDYPGRILDFPYKVIIDDRDDEFHTFYILEYDYRSFDEKGNWTNRGVRSWKLHTVGVMWDGVEPLMETEMKEYEETAEYTYY